MRQAEPSRSAASMTFPQDLSPPSSLVVLLRAVSSTSGAVCRLPGVQGGQQHPPFSVVCVVFSTHAKKYAGKKMKCQEGVTIYAKEWGSGLFYGDAVVAVRAPMAPGLFQFALAYRQREANASRGSGFRMDVER